MGRSSGGRVVQVLCHLRSGLVVLVCGLASHASDGLKGKSTVCISHDHMLAGPLVKGNSSGTFWLGVLHETQAPVLAYADVAARGLLLHLIACTARGILTTCAGLACLPHHCLAETRASQPLT